MNSKEKGKEKRKDEEEDMEMENKFQEYEDLSDYEAATPAVSKPTPTTRAVRAIVVHGIACERPIASNSHMVERVLGRGVLAGARWLLLSSRRVRKATSSMVYFLTEPVRMMEKGQKLKMYGKWHLVDEYDFARGRK